MTGRISSRFAIKDFTNGNEYDDVIIAEVIHCLKSKDSKILVRNEGFVAEDDKLYYNQECLTMGWLIATDLNHLISLVRKGFLITCLIVDDAHCGDNWQYKVRVIEDVEGNIEILVYCKNDVQIDNDSINRLKPFLDKGARISVSNY